MIQLIVLIFLAAIISYLIKKRIDMLFPIVLMTGMLLAYLFGIAGRLEVSVPGTLVVGILFILCLFAKQVHSKVSLVDENFGKKCSQYIFTPQILICFVVCIIFCLLLSTHRVFNWDDLSYWGIYAKDLFFLNHLPSGVENCTIAYKDYTPLMQITEYFFLYGKAEFSEPVLFQTNVCFMYILLLPVLNNFRERNLPGKIGLIVLYVIFPHVFSTQFYYKLGVDYLIGILFGYALFSIVEKEPNRVLYYVRIIIAAAFLALIKSSGIVLTLFVALFFAVYQWGAPNKSDSSYELMKKKSLKVKFCRFIFCGIGIVFIPVLFYISWKVFAGKTGNTGYLSERIETNVRTLAHLFPDYTGTVLLDYIKHIFTYPLTREVFGITAFGIILFISFVYFMQKCCHANSAGEKRLHAATSIGLVVFCLAHIYMYLFVFDDWEAKGLLEYDRYICQYLAGVFYFYVSKLWSTGEKIVEKYSWRINPSWGFVVLFIILLPYPSINNYLIPNHFDTYFAENWKDFADTAKIEWEASGIKELQLPADENHKLMLVANAWTDELQYFTYYAVPQPIAFVANVPAIENGKLRSFIETQMERQNLSYAYVLYNAETSYQGDYMTESRELVADGEILKGGEIYISQKVSPWRLKLYQ